MGVAVSVGLIVNPMKSTSLAAVEGFSLGSPLDRVTYGTLISETWVDNDVKPSLSYGVKKPDEVKGFFERQLGSVTATQMEIGFDVEGNLDIIMSPPKTSSNPQDYINAHQNEYENFFKYGGEEALQYLLAQFESGNAKGLRGQIVMRLCKELLGAKNNVTDESLSPQEWYDALEIHQEIMLPNYEYDGQDKTLKLLYDAEIGRDSDSNTRGGFIIIAPKVIGIYEEGKVWENRFLELYRYYSYVVF